MSHSHSHSHFHSHSHHHATGNTRRLALAFGITLSFVLVEALAGWYSNSLALLSDAGHNITDSLALAFSWFAMWLGQRPASARRTYGYHRAGILAALFNSATLGVMALGIFVEAWHRFFSPVEVTPLVLIVVGIVAVLVNAGTAWLVHEGSQDDLNMRSAFVHLMGDVFSTMGAVVAGVIILFTGWNWLDPLVSALIGGLILWNAWGILRETVSILLESSPKDVDMDQLVADMLKVEGVIGVHDLHVWSITQSLRTLSAHIVTQDMQISAGAAIQSQVGEMLEDQYDIHHATLQFECVACPGGGLFCGMAHHHEEAAHT